MSNGFFRARWRRGKRPAFALCWNIFLFLKYFEIKKPFRYYIKQIDSMLPCIWFSNRSQKTSKCSKNISDTLGYASCAIYLFLPHFDVICDLSLNRRTATWNLFVKYIIPILNLLARSKNTANRFRFQKINSLLHSKKDWYVWNLLVTTVNWFFENGTRWPYSWIEWASSIFE